MSVFPDSITYRWVARDNDIINGSDRFETRFITPYRIPRNGAKPRNVGEPVTYNLNKVSHEKGYLHYFIPTDYDWQDLPAECQNCATLGELCERLLALNSALYPRDFYANPRSPYRSGALSLLQMMFDIWENTSFRWAVVSGGWSPFSWEMLKKDSPGLLECPLSIQVNHDGNTSTVKLSKVLAKKPALTNNPVGAGTQTIRKRMRKISMRVGFNYPWAGNKEGVHMGPLLLQPEGKPLPSGILEQKEQDKLPFWLQPPSPGTPGSLEQNLATLKGMNITLLRWFLLGNGMAYKYFDPQAYRPRRLTKDSPYAFPSMTDTPGLPLPTEAWYFEPPDRLHPNFERDFRLLMDTIRKHSFQIIPSFIDFSFFFNENMLELISDTRKRTKFFDTVLEPHLAIAKEYKKEIYAFEVMNEPYWVKIGWEPNEKKLQPPAVLEDLKLFLHEAVERINRAGLPSTIGHRYANDIHELSKDPAAVTKPQFHYYPTQLLTNYDVNTLDELGDQRMKLKAFLGEFALVVTDKYKLWDGEPDSYKDDAMKRIKSRLERLQSRCQFDTVMIWPEYPDIPPGDVLKLPPDQQHILYTLLNQEFP